MAHERNDLIFYDCNNFFKTVCIFIIKFRIFQNNLSYTVKNF